MCLYGVTFSASNAHVGRTQLLQAFYGFGRPRQPTKGRRRGTWYGYFRVRMSLAHVKGTRGDVYWAIVPVVQMTISRTHANTHMHAHGLRPENVNGRQAASVFVFFARLFEYKRVHRVEFETYDTH